MRLSILASCLKVFSGKRSLAVLLSGSPNHFRVAATKMVNITLIDNLSHIRFRATDRREGTAVHTATGDQNGFRSCFSARAE